MKRTREDITFSKLIRESWDWECAHCRNNFEGRKGSLHCSHIMGRRKKIVRWHPFNAVAHCAGCHRFLTENPILFAEHIKRDYLSEQDYEWLISYSNQTRKWTKTELNNLNAYMLGELRHIRACRREGQRGLIRWLPYS